MVGQKNEESQGKRKRASHHNLNNNSFPIFAPSHLTLGGRPKQKAQIRASSIIFDRFRFPSRVSLGTDSAVPDSLHSPLLTALRCLPLLLIAFCSAAAADSPTDAAAIAREAGARALHEKGGQGLRVLILCDSMGLNGFADELDASFRACPGVARVHTFAACGTNPLSWMKRAPYASATTHCGYLRIESTDDDGGIEVDRDIYGIPAGHKPSGHRVPKIEDLVASIQPDILIFQSGNNFFDLFQGSQSDPVKSCQRMRTYLAPFRQWIASSPGIRHFYWISPPQAGNVTSEVQQAIFDTLKEEIEPLGKVIDSRQITRYPYQSQSSDQMHFWGDEAFAWGRDTFRLVASHMGDSRPKPAPSTEDIRRAIPVEDDAEILVRVRLEKLTPIPDPSSFAPYGDLLVAGLYKVLKVKSGHYQEKQIVIVHPAYINHQPQDLSTLKKRRTFEFLVRELNGDSLWATVRRQDNVAPFDLAHYFLAVDESRHPSHISQAQSR